MRGLILSAATTPLKHSAENNTINRFRAQPLFSLLESKMSKSNMSHLGHRDCPPQNVLADVFVEGCFFISKAKTALHKTRSPAVASPQPFSSCWVQTIYNSVISRALSSGKPSAGATTNALVRSSGAKVNGLAVVLWMA